MMSSTVREGSSLAPRGTLSLAALGLLVVLFGLSAQAARAETLAGTVAVGTGPFHVIGLGTAAYVVNFTSGDVTVIEGSTVAETVTVGAGAWDAAALGDKIYVIHYASPSSLTEIDTAAANATQSLSPVGDYGYGVAAANGKVYTSNYLAGTVTVTDPNDPWSTLGTVTVGSGPSGMAASGTAVYVGNYAAGTVSVIDAVTDTVTATVPVGSAPRAIAVLGRYAYVANYSSANVSVIDTLSNAVVATSTVPAGPSSVAASGEKIYVVSFGAGVFSSIDPGNSYAVATVHSETGIFAVGAAGTKLYVADFDSNQALIFETDETAPTVSVTAPADGAEVSAWAPGVSWGDAATCEYQIDGGSFAALDCSEGGADVPDQSAGAHVLVARGTDAADNIGYATSTFTRLAAASPAAGEDSPRRSSSGRRERRAALGLGEAPVSPKSATSPAPADPAVAPGTPSSDFAARDLEAGTVGEDVRALQRFLNARGFTLAESGPGAPGQETDFFGALTRAALARWQVANGVSPAAGYYGPITRAAIASGR